jgi:hypothetical protein
VNPYRPPRPKIKDDHRTTHGQCQAAQVEPLHASPAEERSGITADERAGDAQDDRLDEAAAIFPRHQDLRHHTHDQAQHDPGCNAHHDLLFR